MNEIASENAADSASTVQKPLLLHLPRLFDLTFLQVRPSRCEHAISAAFCRCISDGVGEDRRVRFLHRGHARERLDSLELDRREKGGNEIEAQFGAHCRGDFMTCHRASVSGSGIGQKKGAVRCCLAS